MPSKDKALIKVGTANQIGVLIDDQLEQAESGPATCAACSSACIDAAKKVRGLVDIVQAEVDAGELDAAEAKAAIKYLTRAVTVVESESRAWALRKHQADGVVRGLKAAVAAVKRVHDEEARKAAAAPEGESTADDRREERRKARAARKKPASSKKKTTKKKSSKKSTAKKKASKRKG